MSTKVASLYAEIGANTSGFDAGAAKVKGGLGNLSSGFTGLLTNTAILTAGIAALEQGFEQTVNVAQAYDQSIYGIMASTGGTAEEISRLVQVLDDAGIELDTVKKSLKEMSKDGTEPTIGEIAKLSDQFLKLGTGAERGKFLMDNFGKSGQDMARAMALGGDEIRRMSSEMDNALVLTGDNIKASEEYRKNLDDLNDSLQSVKVSIGNDLIPVLNDLFDENRRLAEGTKIATAEMGDADPRLIAYAARIEAVKIKNSEARDAVEAHGEALDGVFVPAINEATLWIEKNTIATKEMTDANMDYLGMVGDLTDSNAKIEQQQMEINQQYADGLISIDERNTALGELANKQEEASNRMILAMLQEQLAADGLTTTEMQYLLGVGQQWGIYSQSAVDSANRAIVKAGELKSTFDNLPTQKDMMINFFTTGNAAYIPQEKQQDVFRAHAAGGSFLIPQSYGNEGFSLGNGDTASGGEMISITPRGKQNNNGEIIAALQANKIDYNKMARAFRESLAGG